MNYRKIERIKTSKTLSSWYLLPSLEYCSSKKDSHWLHYFFGPMCDQAKSFMEASHYEIAVMCIFKPVVRVVSSLVTRYLKFLSVIKIFILNKILKKNQFALMSNIVQFFIYLLVMESGLTPEKKFQLLL